MASTIYFLHSKNVNKVKRFSQPKKGDAIILLDSSESNEKFLKPEISKTAPLGNAQSILSYVKKQEDKKLQDRFSYRMEWIQEWAFKKLGNRKSFAEEMVFDSQSLWYYLEYFIHYDTEFLSYDTATARVLLYIDCISEILEKNHPAQIVVENKKGWLNQLLLKIAKQKRIELTALNLPGEKQSMKSKIINHSLVMSTYLKSRILLRYAVAKIFCKKIPRKEVLVITSSRLSNKDNTTDYYWGPIIKEMNRQGISYKVVEHDKIDTPNSLSQLRKRYIPQKYDAQFIGTYYDCSTFREIRKLMKFMKRKFGELDQRPDFRNSFEYRGIGFYNIIRPRIKKIFRAYAPYFADVHAAGKVLIEKENPRLLLIDHEKNYYGRSAMMEAHKRGIPTFAYEGELIYERNAYHTHTAIPAVLDEKSPLWRPIPDKKFLWGEHTKEWYAKKDFFPAEKLEVIGAPKYDFLKGLGKKDIYEMRKKYSAKDNEKLVAVIAGFAPWDEVRMASQSLSKEKARAMLVVKMHPDDLIMNKPAIEKISKEAGTPAVVVQNENASKLVFASDLVITCNTTLIYECILLNKKTILVETGNNLFYSYIKEGLIKPCSKLSQVQSEVARAFGNGQKGDWFDKDARVRFIRKYLHSDDGKASERAVDFIKKFLNTKKQS